MNVFGTVRGRAGVAFDRFLVYGTGGFAYANIDTKVSFPGIANASDTNTHLGWTAGGGVEVAITPNWSAKVEYLFADLGEERYHFNFGGGVKGSGKLSYDQNLVRAGVNYKF